MDLPNLFSSREISDTPQLVIGILLSHTKIQALLLSISRNNLEVLEYSEVIEYTDHKHCLMQTDECLQQLGKESELVDKVVFGLEHDWVVDGEVLDEHKPLLSKIKSELSLDPVGFIDTSEALAQHYLSQNNLYSGIIILFSTSSMTVSYLSQGESKGIEQVGRSDVVVADLREGLARFSQQVEAEQFYLPAKLTISSFDLTEDELKEIKQELLNFNWTEEARFLQMPTIEVISDEEFTKIAALEAARAAAIATGNYSAAAAVPSGIIDAEYASASASEEMGFTEYDAKIDEETDEDSTEEDVIVKPDPPSAQTAVLEETAMDSESSSSTQAEENAASEKAVITDEENVTAVDSSVASSFGIPLTTDKLVDSAKSMKELEKEANELHPGAAEEDPQSFIERFKKSWNEPYKGNRSLKFFVITGFVAGLLVIVLSLTGILYMTAEAVVDVELSSLPISKDIQVTLDPDAQAADPENMILPADSITKTVSAESSLPTTGVKIVGDKAKGKITIYNKTTATKTLDAGTVIKSGDFQFTLDEEVSIASASVKTKAGGEEKEYGKENAAVTASDIGADYNLSEGTEFSVATFSTDTYSAEATDEDFAGGASREVKVVSEEDRTKLRSELRQTLLEQANEELTEESGKGLYILPTTTIADEAAEYNAEVDEEAEELTLQLVLTVEALTYRTEHLEPIAAAVLASEVPDGYELSEEDPQIMSVPSDKEVEEGEQYVLEANLTSFAIPVISTEEIASEISGKAADEADRQLEGRDQIKSVDIQFKPSIASIVRSSMPKKENIIINFRKP